MKYALIIAGLLASTSAFATNINSPSANSAAAASAAAAALSASSSQSNAAVLNRNSVRNSVSTSVSNKQRQRQGQEQQAQSSNSLTIQGDRNINAPGFGGFASGPCTGVGGQVSVGVAGFGGGAGFTALDPECTRRETARILHMLGQTDAAVKLMMASPVVQSMPAEKASATVEPPVVAESGYCQRNPADYYCKK